eukprot:3103429-Prymnesium_polylepis.1
MKLATCRSPRLERFSITRRAARRSGARERRQKRVSCCEMLVACPATSSNRRRVAPSNLPKT